MSELRDKLIEFTNDNDAADRIAEFLNDGSVLELMHLAIEDLIIMMRDERMFVIEPANGWVVKEKDGTPSSIMRIGTRDGLRHIMSQFMKSTINITNDDVDDA